MLEGCQTAEERWGGVSEIIDRWLHDRQQLLVLYCSVNGVEPMGEDNRTLAEKLRELCQRLVDYISTGHFGVYEQLISEAQELDDDTGLVVADVLLPQLEENTTRCLAFNDSCEQLSTLMQLQEAMSQIGETLEERFRLEDQMIERLHQSHREKVA